MKPVLNGTDYTSVTLWSYRKVLRENLQEDLILFFFEIALSWFFSVFLHFWAYLPLQMGDNQNDLAKIVRFKSRVSEILNRKRKLSLEMIRQLHISSKNDIMACFIFK